MSIIGCDSFYYMNPTQTLDFLIDRVVSLNNKTALLAELSDKLKRMSFSQLKTWWKKNKY
jgi:hypothetical protein